MLKAVESMPSFSLIFIYYLVIQVLQTIVNFDNRINEIPPGLQVHIGRINFTKTKTSSETNTVSQIEVLSGA